MPKLREPLKKEEEALKADDNQLQGQEQQQEEVVVQQQDEGADELKRQLEVLRTSEAAARQQATQAATERDAAIQRANERGVALTRSQKDATDSRLYAIQSGMAAAEAEAEDAKKALRMAVIEQDIDAQIAAQEKMTEAKANLINLTNGKAALERAIKEEAERPKPQPQQTGDALDRTNLPQTAKDWLRAHPEYLSDNRKNAKIQSLHWDVVDEGHQPFSDAYYHSLEVHLGLREKPRQIVAEEEDYGKAPHERSSIVSAPVSRESVSTGTGNRQTPVRLTQAQREAAKMAGITETEYAKQLGVMNQAKANGAYGGQP